MTFHAWLSSGAKTTADPVGDLVQDWRRAGQPGGAAFNLHPPRPKRLTTLRGLQRYLRGCRACPEALEAAEHAWGRYQGSTLTVPAPGTEAGFKRLT